MLVQRTHNLASTPLTTIAELSAFPASPKKPERQRGLWSFITWPFFLSQVMAADSLVGKSAGVPHQDDDGVAHATSHSDTPSDDVLNPAAMRVAAIDADVQAEAVDARHNIHIHVAQSGLLLESLPGGEPVTLKASSSDTGQGGSGGGGASLSETIDGTDGLRSAGVEVSPGGAGPNLNPDQLLSDLAPSTGLHADLNKILDFDLHLGSGGSLVGANLSLALDLNPAHLISDLSPSVRIDTSPDLNLDQLLSDLAPSIGLHADLNKILGFDLHLGSGGSLVGANLSLAFDLNPAHLISDLSPSVGIDTSVDLKHLLGFDAQLGVDGLFAAHALPDLGDLELPVLKSTLAEVTGLQMLGGVRDLIIPFGNGRDRDPTATLIKSIDALTGESEVGVTLSASSAPATVISLTSGIGLGQNGDISSGGTITFPAHVLASVDELFTGGRYTDYNVTLQSKITDSGHVNDTLNSGIVGNLAVAPPPVDAPSDSHSAGASPLPGQHVEAALLQIPTHIEDLSMRVHSI